MICIGKTKCTSRKGLFDLNHLVLTQKKISYELVLCCLQIRIQLGSLLKNCEFPFLKLNIYRLESSISLQRAGPFGTSHIVIIAEFDTLCRDSGRASPPNDFVTKGTRAFVLRSLCE